MEDFDNEDEKGKMSTDFSSKKLGEAYSSNETSDDITASLNHFCKSIYGKDVGSGSGQVDFSYASDDEIGVSNQRKLARDLLKYCSPLGQKPSTVNKNKDVSSYRYVANSIGAANEDTLASTRRENYYF